MVHIAIPDDLAKQLERVARRENRQVSEVIEAMLAQYTPGARPEEESAHPLDAFVGIYDDDITYMSTSVRETIQTHFQKK